MTFVISTRTFLVAYTVKHLSTMRETWVRSLGWEDHLEKEMAIHSSTLAGKHVPCPVTNHKGKEDGSECMYVHLIHFCAVEINAMSKSTILQ